MSCYGITQADAVEAVTARIMEILKERSSGLDSVDRFISGDSAIGGNPACTLWVMEDECTVAHNQGLSETWDLMLSLVCVTTGENPTERRRKARSVISKAMSVLVSDRRLGLDFVQDVLKVRVMFRPPSAPTKAGGVDACAGVVRVVFKLIETEVQK
jgi:hypothetical protein